MNEKVKRSWARPERMLINISLYSEYAQHEFLRKFGVVVFSILETFSYMHSNHESRT